MLILWHGHCVFNTFIPLLLPKKKGGVVCYPLLVPLIASNYLGTIFEF